MEPVTVLLTAAIAKSVFKAWFQESSFAATASDNFLSLVEKVVPDIRARNAAVRQLDRIAEKAADAIEPYLGFEHVGLTKDQVKRASERVALAIESRNVTAHALAKIDFDPSVLAVEISAELDRRDLSDADLELADSITQQSAELIIDLSAALPEFQRETFTEVLKRESLLIERVDRIFEEIEKIKENSGAHLGASNLRFEENYRRSIARNLDQVELFGLDTSTRPTSRQHNLSTAYISLSVSSSSKASDSDASSQQPIRAEDAANVSPLVVVKGEAGSGKTTFLQSLAVRTATASFQAGMEEWNSRVPFFVRLRALSDGNLPSPEKLPGLVTPSIAGTMPEGWVHEQLKDGRGLLLVDGLDEISKDKRDKTRLWIKDLLGSFANTRVVITTRPPAIPDGWLKQNGFSELELLPMSPEDVDQFIDHWHEAVAGEELDRSRVTPILSLATPLKEKIRSDRALQELASTPLLCAMLCAMNRDRNEVLPTNRIALYDAAVHMIIHARDEQRRIEVNDLPDLDFETKLAFLQEIAFWMMQNGLSMVDRWRLDDFVETRAPNLTRLAEEVPANKIVDVLILRSGVIRSPVEGKVDFIHNAFKEFLSAKGIISGDHFGFLEGQLKNEAWREVAVLAAAMADDIRRSDFIRRILERGDRNQRMRSTYHLLAVRCLETCTQLEATLQTEIRERLKGLHSPKNITEARALSAAGNLAIPLAEYKKNRPAKSAAACVRTLRMINTPAALKALEPYGEDTRATVQKEILSAWSYFEPAEYARRVLSGSKGFRGRLELDSSRQLLGAKYLRRIEDLFIGLPMTEVSPALLRELRNLKQLKTLDIFVSGSVDIGSLSNLNKLSVLRTTCGSTTGIGELVPLRNLRELEIDQSSELDLHGVTLPDGIIDLTLNAPRTLLPDYVLEKVKLQRLNISNGNGVEISKALEGQDQIERLTFGGDSSFHVLEALRGREKLSSLSVIHAEDIKNLSIFSAMPSLVSLTLSGATNLGSLDGLENLHRLESLSLIGATNLRDLSRVRLSRSLQTLRLDVPDDVDLEPLRDLEGVRLAITRGGFVRARDMGLPVFPLYWHVR